MSDGSRPDGDPSARIATVALLRANRCPTDALNPAVAWLEERPIPPDARGIQERVEQAIHYGCETVGIELPLDDGQHWDVMFCFLDRTFGPRFEHEMQDLRRQMRGGGL